MIDYEALREKAVENLGVDAFRYPYPGPARTLDAYQEALQDFLQEKIVLRREEITEAKDKRLPCDKFLNWDSDLLKCGPDPRPIYCRFCRLLTEFASQGDPVGKGEEDE